MADRPNIVLFLTDDHAAWALSGTGDGRAPTTPVLDRLAADGVRFHNAFTPSPVCSPARACLLTGRTPSQVGIHDWIDEALPEIGAADWLHGTDTLSQRLRAVGYRCGLSGKWHLGRSDTVPPGYDWCFGIPYGQGAHRGWNGYHRDGVLEQRSGVKTDVITDEAVGFLDRAPTDRPFFLQVGYLATHSPWADHDTEDVGPVRTVAAGPEHRWRLNEGFPQWFGGEERIARCTEQYHAAVGEIDRGVGRVLDALRRQGRLESTIVVYTSDHGLNLGQHGFWGKGNGTRPLNMYEESIRVPLLWSWPGTVPAGRAVTAGVDHYDTFRTLLDLAGTAPAGDEQPGHSYRSLLAGDGAWPWPYRFGEYGDLRMVRSDRYKLLCRHGAGPDELFDLDADPGETLDRLTDPDLEPVRRELRAQLDRFYASYSDPRWSGLRVRELPRHNLAEAWRDGVRELRTADRP